PLDTRPASCRSLSLHDPPLIPSSPTPLLTPSLHHICFFCFYWSGDRRALHSFPTRRSSDLSVPALRHPQPALHATNGRVIHDQTDRKSTRLNSSHVKISYAVFCLKKKRTWKIFHTH